MRYLSIILALLVTTPVFAGNHVFSPYGAHHLHFGHHDNAIVVRQKLVEIDAEVALGLNAYVANGKHIANIESQKEELNAKTIRDLVDLVKSLIGNQGGGTVLPPVETPNEEPVPVDNTPAPGDDLDTKVFKIFRANCATCHGESKQSAGLKLIGKDKDGEYLVNLPLESRVLVHEVTTGVDLEKYGLKTMPLGDAALSDEDVAVLRDWKMVKAIEMIKGKK